MKEASMKPDIIRLSRHQWQHILPAAGIAPHYLKNAHQSCPLCGGKDRYRFDDKDGNGTYFCNQCGAGNGFTLLQKHLNIDFKQAAQIVSQILGIDTGNKAIPQPTPFRQPQTPKAQTDRLPRLMRIWHDTEPLNHTAKAYFARRGLNPDTLPQTAQIRFIDRLDYWAQDTGGKPLQYGTFSAIVGAVSNQAGQIQGLHLTYLQTRENGAITKLIATHPQTHQAMPAKKMQSRFSGSLKGCAVQIEPPNAQGQLLIAEGIETALAARELFSLPCTAALSANGLKQWQPPQNLKELLIIADNDTPKTTGKDAAIFLAGKMQSQGITVKIWQPETAGFDALDELNRLKHQAA